jgi:hypothetical protein
MISLAWNSRDDFLSPTAIRIAGAARAKPPAPRRRSGSAAGRELTRAGATATSQVERRVFGARSSRGLSRDKDY